MARGFVFSEEIVEGERQSATTRLKPHAMTHAFNKANKFTQTACVSVSKKEKERTP
jgi:hypothetical protein